MSGIVTVAHAVSALHAMVQFEMAQRECNRMWHAFRYARLNLIELKARRWVSSKDLAEAHAMIKSTRERYWQACEKMYAWHDRMTLKS